MSLLGRDGQAVAEGRVLLAGSADRFLPLLVLAHAYRRSRRWHETALLQEEALRLASSPAREALARHEIGVRFFDQALYRDAAAELEYLKQLVFWGYTASEVESIILDSGTPAEADAA